MPSADRIPRLRDAGGDGVAEPRSTPLQGLHSPFGMVPVGQAPHVAITDPDVVPGFPYPRGDTVIRTPGVVLAALPAECVHHHRTKNLLAGADARSLDLTAGSNRNAAERGIAAGAGRAGVWRMDIASGRLMAVARARRPDCAFGAHVAPPGLAGSGGHRQPPTFAQGMFVGLHGSWNRRPRSGYPVVFVPFADAGGNSVRRVSAQP